MFRRALHIAPRLVLVTAAYAGAFALFRRYPYPECLLALMPGTLLAAVIVLTRWGQIQHVLVAGLITILGTVFGLVFFLPNTGNGLDGPWPEFIAAMAGTMVGAVPAFFNSQLLRARDQKRSRRGQEEGRGL